MTTIQPRTTAAPTPVRAPLLTRRVARYTLGLLALIILAVCAALLDQQRITLHLLATLTTLLLVALMALLAAFALRSTRDHSDLIDFGPLELF